MAKTFEQSMAELSAPSAEQRISALLRHRERILWTGRPNVEQAVAFSSKRNWRKVLTSFLPIVIVISVALYQLMQALDIDNLRDLIDALPDETLLMLAVPFVIVVAIYLLPRLFKMDSKSRLSRYFESLSYGITNQRLLIVENDKLAHAFRPDEVGELKVINRTEGCDDLLWSVSEPTSDDMNPWQRERATIGFKAISNVMDVKRRIEKWINTHQKRAGQAVADFISDSSSPGLTHASTRKIMNPKLGLAIDVPEEWKIKARRRRKAYGTIFLDFERWKDPQATDDWNVLRIEGPARTSVEIHVDDGDPVLTLEDLRDSKIGSLFGGGEVVATKEGLVRREFRGFSVTRRIVVAEDATDIRGARAVMRRQTVFTNPRRQLAIVSTWPDGAEALQQAVDVIEKSLEI